MPETLLVPVDGLPLAEAALPPAKLLAQVLRAKVDLVRVVPPDDPLAADDWALGYVDSIASQLRSDRVPVSTLVVRGDPGACIVRAAMAEHAAMVVMSTHGRSGLRRMVLGSVAAYVVAHSPAPTFLVRAGCHPHPQLKVMLLAIDGSGAAPLALTIELARASGAHVVLLRVVTPSEFYIWQRRPGPVLDEPQAVVDARQHLNDLAARMRADGISAETRVHVGSVAPTIVSMAATVGADIIVMTTHAKTGTDRAVLGSVADTVVLSACQPVLLSRLIPPPQGQLRPGEVARALQHRHTVAAPRLSIPEPLDHVQHTPGRVRWGHVGN